MPKLKEKLENMVQEGVIIPVKEATSSLNNIVVAENKNGDIRVTLDPKDLNKAIKRHHYKIPTLKDITSQLSGGKVFSILDEKDGYHQEELDHESSMLCTFQTPFGRFRYLRMPMGLRSSSEIFQMKNYEAFGDIEGVFMIADDMLIAGKDTKDHDKILETLLNRAERLNIKFNKDKIQFKVPSVKYMGNVITAEGMKVDSDKVKAILELPEPVDKSGIQRLLH